MVIPPRSQTIAETTPLLPQAHVPPYNLPIFLRVCHSPWPLISQKRLLAVRAVIASFLTIVFALDLLYKINYTQRGRQFAFEASSIGLLIQTLYYWITTSWTLQHILAPFGRLPPEEQAKGRILARIQAGFSAPMSADSSTKSYLVFMTFYTTSVTIPFVVSIAYWLLLHRCDHILDQRSEGDSLHCFLLISTTTFNSAIAFVEVMFLNGVGKQKDLAIQVASLIATYLLYAMWTVFGCFITGEYVYKYLDPDYVGWRGIVTTDIVILSLIVTTFYAQRELHALREILLRNLKCAQ